MNVPNFIKTEWRGRGHAVLEFECPVCKLFQRKKKKLSHAKNVCKNQTVISSMLSSSDEMTSADCQHPKSVDIFLSTFNVWEFEEESQNLEENLLNENSKPHLNSFKTIDEENVPPTISDEMWKLWQQHWEDWKDIYVNLSWVQRFRSLCNNDLIEWFENYCASFPEMLSFVSYYENIKLENESNIDKIPDDEREPFISKLYDEFSSKRYWIHFRLFVRDNNLEMVEKLKDFFSTHDILYDPPEASPDLDEGIDLRELPVSDKLENLPPPVNINNDLAHDCPIAEDKLLPNEGNFDESEKDDKTKEVLEKDIENHNSGLCKQESENLNDEKDTVNKPDDVNSEEINDMKTLHDCQEIDPMSQVPKGPENNESLSVTTDDTKGAKTGRNLKRKSSFGVVWALKHIQQLGQEAKSSQPESSNQPFVFGCTEDVSKDEVDGLHLKFNKSDHSEVGKARVHTKRKHEELELPNSTVKVSEEQKGICVPKPTSKPLFTRSIGGILIHFQQLIFKFSRSIVSFIIALIGLNPFKRIFWWRPKQAIEDPVRSMLMRNEKNAVKMFKNLFKPTIRYIPDTTCTSTSSPYLTHVTDWGEERESIENLVKVTVEEAKGSEPDFQAGIYVTYMTEDDIDCALEDMVELATVVPKEETVHRTLTIFDENGMPQDVIKVPADEGKMRCMLEDDYKRDTEAKHETNKKDGRNDMEDWLYSSNIYFDNEGNPVAIPIHRHQKKESLHRKINKVLQNSRLMRLSKGDVYTPPDDLPQELQKYWRQRYRLFLRYDEGIRLDDESWFSVTPEMVAAHQAERCTCDTVIDAFCGAGGSAIQLAGTCNNVIAIDIDPAKIELARHNAEVYGVADRIQFIQGDFFQLAPGLKADAILLSPPWGGMEYLEQSVYNVFSMGGQMSGRKLFELASKITPNIAIYLPKNSNLFQVIELAGDDGRVDIEFSHISNKRKSLTAYYGDLVDFPFVETDY